MMIMEDYKYENSKKRARDEPDVESPEKKLIRLDSSSSTVTSSGSDHTEPDPDNSGECTPEAKRIQDDLLNILDDSDPVNEPVPATKDLDSFIKSFEEEILVHAPASAPAPAPAPVPEVASEPGESRPVLGYLLEASDDELGLPPSFSSGDEKKMEAVDFESGAPGHAGLGFGGMNIIGFEEDQIPSYDSFEYELGGVSDSNNQNINYNYNNSNDFVALGGLFDYTDESCDPGDVSEFAWRTESLSAS